MVEQKFADVGISDKCKGKVNILCKERNVLLVGDRRKLFPGNGKGRI